MAGILLKDPFAPELLGSDSTSVSTADERDLGTERALSDQPGMKFDIGTDQRSTVPQDTEFTRNAPERVVEGTESAPPKVFRSRSTGKVIAVVGGVKQDATVIRHKDTGIEYAIVGGKAYPMGRPAPNVSDNLKALGKAAASGAMYVAENIARTPDAIAREARGLSKMDAGGIGPVEDFQKALGGVVAPVAQALGDLRLGDQDEDAATDPGFTGFTNLANRIAQKREEWFSDPINTALGERASEAGAALFEDGDAGPAMELAKDPMAWGVFVSQAVPSLVAALYMGGRFAGTAWLEGMEFSNNAAEFEARTGVPIDDEEFAKGMLLKSMAGGLLEKAGLDIITGKIPILRDTPGVLGLAMRSVAKGVGEGGTELGQNTAGQLATQFYDPEAKLYEGAIESFMGGVGAGAGTGALADPAEQRRRKIEESIKADQPTSLLDGEPAIDLPGGIEIPESTEAAAPEEPASGMQFDTPPEPFGPYVDPMAEQEAAAAAVAAQLAQDSQGIEAIDYGAGDEAPIGPYAEEAATTAQRAQDQTLLSRLADIAQSGSMQDVSPQEANQLLDFMDRTGLAAKNPEMTAALLEQAGGVDVDEATQQDYLNTIRERAMRPTTEGMEVGDATGLFSGPPEEAKIPIDDVRAKARQKARPGTRGIEVAEPEVDEVEGMDFTQPPEEKVGPPAPTSETIEDPTIPEVTDTGGPSAPPVIDQPDAPQAEPEPAPEVADEEEVQAETSAQVGGVPRERIISTREEFLRIINNPNNRKGTADLVREAMRDYNSAVELAEAGKYKEAIDAMDRVSAALLQQHGPLAEVISEMADDWLNHSNTIQSEEPNKDGEPVEGDDYIEQDKETEPTDDDDAGDGPGVPPEATDGGAGEPGTADGDAAGEPSPPGDAPADDAQGETPQPEGAGDGGVESGEAPTTVGGPDAGGEGQAGGASDQGGAGDTAPPDAGAGDSADDDTAAATKVTVSQAKKHWRTIEKTMVDEDKAAFSDAKWRTLDGAPHVIGTDGNVYHFTLDEGGNIQHVAGFVSQKAAAKHRGITPDPVATMMEQLDAASIAKLLDVSPANVMVLPGNIVRVITDPGAPQERVEARMLNNKFRVTDRAAPPNDDPSKPRIMVSAVYDPPRPKLEGSGVDVPGSRRHLAELRGQFGGASKDAKERLVDEAIEEIEAMASVVFPAEREGLTFGAFMWREALIANLRPPLDYIAEYAEGVFGELDGRTPRTKLRALLSADMSEGVIDTLGDAATSYVNMVSQMRDALEGAKRVMELDEAARVALGMKLSSTDKERQFGQDFALLLISPYDGHHQALIDELLVRYRDDEESTDQSRRWVKRNPHTPPQLTDVVRRGGKDHRNGRDVSQEDFERVFAPKGFQWGNWATQVERQTHLNMVYDGLMDLSDLIGVPPKMLFMNGKMALAIGARGRSNANAHYEPPQTANDGIPIINLTKEKGNGTVAHEWFHALEDFLRKNPDSRLGYELTERTRAAMLEKIDASKLEQEVREVMSAALDPTSNERNIPPRQAAIKFLNDPTTYTRLKRQTQFDLDAQKIDGGTRKYWATAIEMMARSFEAFVFDTAKGGSPYLVHPNRADNAISKENGYTGRTYPTGEERTEWMAQVWKDFLEVIDKGTLGVKTYKPEYHIEEAGDGDYVIYHIVDQHGVPAHDGSSRYVDKKAAESALQYRNENAKERVLDPMTRALSRARAKGKEIEGRLDAIMKEMGIADWPEFKDGSYMESMFFQLRAGWWPNNNNDFKAFVAKALNIPTKDVDSLKLKAAQESFEGALARYAGQLIVDMRADGMPDKEIYARLHNLYKRQPVLGVRTTTSLNNQAYSTPAPIAFIASLMARVQPKHVVFDPTAGNGLLLLGANPSKAVGFELDGNRANHLRIAKLGKVVQGDALKSMADGKIKDQEADVVLANPPFGALRGDAAQKIDGYVMNTIDQLIAAKSLSAMSDDGRAVIILGANMQPGLISKKDLPFLNWLSSHYNVVDHFEIAGGLYDRMGASWPLRVLVVAGRYRSNRLFDQATKIDRVESYDDLWQRAADATDRSGNVMVGTDPSFKRDGGSNQQPGGVPGGDQGQDQATGGGGGRGPQGSPPDVPPGNDGRSGRNGDGGGASGERGGSGANPDGGAGGGGTGGSGPGGGGRGGASGADAGGSSGGLAGIDGLTDSDLDDLIFGDPGTDGTDDEAPQDAPRGGTKRKPRGGGRGGGGGGGKGGTKITVPSPAASSGDGQIDDLLGAIGGILGERKSKAPKTIIVDESDPNALAGLFKPDDDPSPKGGKKKKKGDASLQIEPTMPPPFIEHAAEIPSLAAHEAAKETHAANVVSWNELFDTTHDTLAGGDAMLSIAYKKAKEVDGSVYRKLFPVMRDLWDRVVQLSENFANSITKFREILVNRFGAKILAYIKAFVTEHVIPEHRRAQLVADLPSGKKPLTEAAQDNDLQVVYQCRSRGGSDGIFVPRGLAEYLYAALDKLEAKYAAEYPDGIDQFVMSELNYESEEAMFQALSGYQIDALALAIDAVKRGDGFIIGDATGVGKGRTAAALIEWATRNDKVPIFFSYKDDLYSDMYRDLTDIGKVGSVNFVVTNTDTEVQTTDSSGRKKVIQQATKESARALVDAVLGRQRIPEGEDANSATWTVHKLPLADGAEPLKGGDRYQVRTRSGTPVLDPVVAKSEDAARSLVARAVLRHRTAAQSIEGWNAIMTTYSQVNVENDRRRMIRELVKQGRAMLIMDESHSASGESATGEFFRSILSGEDLDGKPADWKPPATVYLSATFAKRPNNMPVYLRTGIRHVGDGDPKQIADIFRAGGNALQQVVSEMLTSAGQMIRRERSFANIKINYHVDEQNGARDARRADTMTEALRAIMLADRQFHAVMQDKKFLKRLAEDLLPPGAIDPTDKKALASLTHHAFTSIVHNYVRQMLLGLKIDTAAARTIADLNEGKKVVLTTESTMESHLDAYLEVSGAKVGDDLTGFGWNTILDNALRKTLTIKYTDQFGDPQRIDVPTAMLPPHVRMEYVSAYNTIKNLSLPDVPASPIDKLRNALSGYGWYLEDGYRVYVKRGDEPAGVTLNPLVTYEVSGRDMVIDYSGESPVLAKRNDPESVDAVREFNYGTADVMILTNAGSTGISLHASEKVRDQRPRLMRLLQPSADISQFVQMCGRVNRTGQVELPDFEVLASAVPAERRPMAMLRKKIASLSANTTAAKRNALDVETAVDFINEYGDDVVLGVLRENNEWADFIGVDLPQDADAAAPEDLALKASGRAALFTSDEQELFYDTIEDLYTQEIERRNATGTNRLIRRTLDLDAVPIEEVVLDDGEDTSNAFQDDAFLTKYETNFIGELPEPERLVKEVADALGLTPEQMNPTSVADANARLRTKIEDDLRVLYDEAINAKRLKIEQLQKELADPAVTEAQRDQLQRRIATVNADIANFGQRKFQTLEILQEFPIGTTMTTDLDGLQSNGIVVGYNIKKKPAKAGNPYAPSNFFLIIERATFDGRYPIAVSKILANREARQAAPILSRSNRNGWQNMENFIDTTGITGRRMTAYIATRNILSAIEALAPDSGEIISFTARGEEKPVTGILMPRNFRPGQLAQRNISIKDPEMATGILLRGLVQYYDKLAAGASYYRSDAEATRKEVEALGVDPKPLPDHVYAAIEQRGISSRGRVISFSWRQGDIRMTIDIGTGKKLLKDKQLAEAIGQDIATPHRGAQTANVRIPIENLGRTIKYLRTITMLYGPPETRDEIRAERDGNDGDAALQIESTASMSNALPALDTSALRRNEAEDDIDALREAVRRSTGWNPPADAFSLGKLPDSIPEETRRGIDGLSRLLGVRVVVFRNNAAKKVRFNGMWIRGRDAIYLDQDAAKNPLAVIGHEFLHLLKSRRPDLYVAFGKAIEPIANKGEWFKEFERVNKLRADQGWEPLSLQMNTEEVVADFFGQMFTDRQFWRDVSAQNPSIAARVVRMFVQFIDRLIATFSNRPNNDAEKYVTDLMAAREAAATAVGRFLAEGGGKMADEPGLYDSAMQISPGPQTSTAEFRRWFGNSKVVDEQGRPLVVYHGTRSDIDQFGGKWYHKFYFADDPRYASAYAGEEIGGGGANVMPVYLSIQNPLDLAGLGSDFVSSDAIIAAMRAAGANKAADAVSDRQYERYGRKQGVNVWELWHDRNILEAVKSDGFDGVIQREQSARNGTEMSESRVFVAFRPEQIKSAIGNRGTFDPSNPDIRFSLSSKDQTESAEFKRWFGDSKVVDEQGKPLVVYHGTTKDFSRFNLSLRSGMGGQLGFWFASDPSAIEPFQRVRVPSEDRPNTVPAYLSIQKPMEYDGWQSFTSAAAAFGKGSIEENIKAMRAKLVRSGHDGVVIRGSETDSGVKRDDWIAFRPEQIKSATGNNGQFDPSNPDIMLQIEEPRRAAAPTPPPASGMVRYYHGGDPTDVTGPLWFTSDLNDGKGWASRDDSMSLWYVDVPKNDPVRGGDEDFGVLPPTRIELPAEIANRRQRFIERGVTVPPEQATVAAMPRKLEGSEAALRAAEESEVMRDALERAGALRHKPTLAERMKDMTDRVGTRITQGLFDQFRSIKELDYRAYMLARMSKSSDGPLEALLHMGRVYLDNDGSVRLDRDKGGFVGKLADLKGEHDTFLAWVIGKRADELMRRADEADAQVAKYKAELAELREAKKRAMSNADIEELRTLPREERYVLDDLKKWEARAAVRERNLTRPQINALLTLNRGTMPDGRSRAETYRQTNEYMRAYNKSVLDLAEKAGIIDGESRQTWEQEFYVPFYRVMEDGSTQGPAVFSDKLVNQKGIVRLLGGKEMLADPLSNVLQNWSHLLDASLRNQAAVATLDAAVDVGAATTTYAGAKGAVYVLKGGQKHYYDITDPLLMDAVKAVGFNGFKGPVMDTLGLFKRILTRGVTLTPTFRLRNAIRDTLSVVANNEISYNFLGNVAQGWALTDEENPAYQEMIAGGAVMRFGTHLEGNRAEYTKRLIEEGIAEESEILDTAEKFKAFTMKAWDAYEQWGDRMENMNRAALYQQLRDKGYSHLEAAYKARDIMDFSLQGSWAAIRFLNQAVPFLNARLQGMYRLGRGHNEDPRRFWLVVGGVVMATMALWLRYRDDEDWKKREDWDRETYWWFKIPWFDGTEKAFRMPKPFEIGTIASMVERGMDWAATDEMTGRQFLMRLEHMVTEQLSLNPIPQAVRPIVELIANKDMFTWRDIETMGMERVAKTDRAQPQTSLVARGVGAITGRLEHVPFIGSAALSPVQIDHLIRGYFGSVGTLIVAAADVPIRWVTPQKEATPRIDDYPVIGDFIKDLPSYQSRYVTQLYDAARKYEEIVNTARQRKKLGDKEGARELLLDNPGVVGIAKSYDSATRKLSAINQQIKRVQASDLTPEQKRRQLDGLYERRNRIAERAVTKARRREERSRREP